MVGEAAGFTAKEQIIAPLHRNVPQSCGGPGRHHPTSIRGLGLEKGFPTGVLNAIDMVPIVQTGPPPRLFVHREPDGVHDVEPAARGRYRAPDRPSVIGNFRLYQHNVKRWPIHNRNDIVN